MLVNIYQLISFYIKSQKQTPPKNEQTKGSLCLFKKEQGKKKLHKGIPLGKQPRKERTTPREQAVVTRIRPHAAEKK